MQCIQMLHVVHSYAAHVIHPYAAHVMHPYAAFAMHPNTAFAMHPDFAHAPVGLVHQGWIAPLPPVYPNREEEAIQRQIMMEYHAAQQEQPAHQQ